MKVITHNQLDLAVYKEWHALWEKSSYANASNSPAWLTSLLKAYSYQTFRIMMFYRNNKLVAVAYVVKEKRFGLSCYTAGPGNFSYGVPFLLDPKDTRVIKEIGTQLRSMGTVVLDNIPQKFIARSHRYIPEVRFIPQTRNYFLRLQNDIQKNSMLPLYKLFMKKAKKYNERITFKRFKGFSKNAMKSVFQIDKENAKYNQGYLTFVNQKHKELYKSLAQNLKEHFTTHLLYFDKKPIAYEMGFVIGSTYFANQISYLRAYRFLAPGKVIIVKLLESISQKNIIKIDFGSGESDIKQKLTNEYDVLSHVVIAKHNSISQYIIICHSMRDKLYQLVNKNKKLYSLYRTIRNGRKIIS